MKWVVCSCIAAEKPYGPSLFELEEYCRSDRYKRCPFYLELVSEKYEVLA
ncbi:MAG: hypothetical protein HZA11_03760 [Nitrospirae bacterium]|nr:hypothetical protein [Nitrospirota bacterium]